MRKAIAIALVFFWLAGCGPVITASSRVKSPDGRWTAIVESKQWSGPGNDFDATEVQLQQANEQPFKVLDFAHEYATMKIELAWTSPQHLDVHFGPSDRKCDHVVITFQAIQAAGIEIATRPLPGPTNTVEC